MTLADDERSQHTPGTGHKKKQPAEDRDPYRLQRSADRARGRAGAITYGEVQMTFSARLRVTDGR